MKCEELLRVLNDYIDGELAPSFCAEFEAHMRDCNPCEVVVDTINKTVKLYQGNTLYEIPFEFREKLHKTLAEKWNQHHHSQG